ncbi:MAG TPA: formate--tetrahydrofolate ligase [Nitrospirales bacterium]|jgi:formate--tetrahydrofolate ligase|nr:formate--tetrahydrofolate ligase [Nitrospirales bacterium]
MPPSAAPLLKRVQELADELGLLEDELIPYGRFKGKIALAALDRLRDRPLGRYVLVTAINPTPLGEGKTVTAIGLAMGLCRLGRRTVVTLRQPSLGPVFGVKGGGAGGGRAQVVPQEEVNLHLTGDAHAVAAAHNLLAAFVDNHLSHGNSLQLDHNAISWPRVMGLNDRELRQVTLQDGRRSQFVITEASEVMAIIALAADLKDLRRRLGRILVGMTQDGRPVSAEDLRCAGAMAALLRDALNPNLVQTAEGTPALIHAGPFGNIAHGSGSIVADALALRLADYVVTEAGFGSDLGAEKFFNIKCRVSGLRPAAAVIVATLRALKLHGGAGSAKPGLPLPAALTGPNWKALARGCANLHQHIANVRTFGVPAVVAVNAFADDPKEELEYVKVQAVEGGAVAAAMSTPWSDGGAGAEALAVAVVRACEQPSSYRPLYEDAATIEQKLETIARRIYGADGVTCEPTAIAQIETAIRLGYGHFPICMAKTQYSLSHDPQLLGRPRGFTLPIRELRILAGAEFLTAVCGSMQLMPGLPKSPAGERVDVDPETGRIVGLT